LWCNFYFCSKKHEFWKGVDVGFKKFGHLLRDLAKNIQEGMRHQMRDGNQAQQCMTSKENSNK
jgi:hypothetical protein